MKEMYPQVTVLMSVYNSEKYVAAAIESILAQSLTDFEFLLYDDCSTDNSLEILKKYASLDNRIILVSNSINRGLTATLVEGMNNARGKYLARMDADDICYPERLFKQVAYLEQHQEISLLGSSVVFFDDTGYEFVGYQPLEHNEIKVELLLGYTMMHPSVMMRLNDFRKHNLNYDISYRYSQDFDLWVRAVALLKFANIKEPLLKMREHANKISRELKPQQMAFSDKIRKFQLDDLKIYPSHDEIRIFNILGSSYLLTTIDDLNKMHNLCKKMYLNNKNLKVFNNKILKKALIKTQQNQYYTLLKNRNKVGLKYWSSNLFLNSLDDFIFNFKMILRTASNYFS